MTSWSAAIPQISPKLLSPFPCLSKHPACWPRRAEASSGWKNLNRAKAAVLMLSGIFRAPASSSESDGLRDRLPKPPNPRSRILYTTEGKRDFPFLYAFSQGTLSQSSTCRQNEWRFIRSLSIYGGATRCQAWH